MTYLKGIQEIVRNAELCGAYSIYKSTETPRRGRPALGPKVGWHDLQLERKYHQGLAAVIILTHKPSGEFWLWNTSDVYVWFTKANQQLRANQMIEPARLQRLYERWPDFHVQLVTCGQWMPGESVARRETWLDGCDKAGQICQRLLSFAAGDSKCINYQPAALEKAPVHIADDYCPLSTQAQEISHRKFPY